MYFHFDNTNLKKRFLEFSKKKIQNWNFRIFLEWLKILCIFSHSHHWAKLKRSKMSSQNVADEVDPGKFSNFGDLKIWGSNDLGWPFNLDLALVKRQSAMRRRSSMFEVDFDLRKGRGDSIISIDNGNGSILDIQVCSLPPSCGNLPFFISFWPRIFIIFQIFRTDFVSDREILYRFRVRLPTALQWCFWALDGAIE